jgi:hypothetical protein
MSANVAFLTRLARIAGETVCAETRATRARALVHAYETVLYVGLGIAGQRRPTARAKEIANESFEALRRELLKSEIDAPPATMAMYAAARERVEMARRALALRVTIEDAGAPALSGRDDDRQRLASLRGYLRDRYAATQHRDAIRASRELLDFP